MSSLATIVILAGGAGSRWGKYKGVEKHFLEVDGETLIARLVRLARQHATEAKVYIVVTDESQPWPDGVGLIPPKRIHGTDHDKLVGSQWYWSDTGRTLVMWGDTWLSDDGAKALFTDDSAPVLWFGRLGPSA